MTYLLEDALSRHGTYCPYVLDSENVQVNRFFKARMHQAAIGRSFWTPIALDAMIWLYLEEIELVKHLVFEELDGMGEFIAFLINHSFEVDGFLSNAAEPLSARIWNVIDVRSRSVVRSTSKS